MSLPFINLLHLTDSLIWPREDFKGQGDYRKVKLPIKVAPRSGTPTPLTSVPTNFEIHTPYGLQDIARTRLSNSRSLWQDQMSNQGHTIKLPTYTP